MQTRRHRSRALCPLTWWLGLAVLAAAPGCASTETAVAERGAPLPTPTVAPALAPTSPPAETINEVDEIDETIESLTPFADEPVLTEAAFFTWGSVIGFAPDGQHLLVADLHPTGRRGCEAASDFAVWRVNVNDPSDPKPELASDHAVASAGVSDFSFRNGRATWLEWCDGVSIGPFAAQISDAGELTNVRSLAPVVHDTLVSDGLLDWSPEITQIAWHGANELAVMVGGPPINADGSPDTSGDGLVGRRVTIDLNTDQVVSDSHDDVSNERFNADSSPWLGPVPGPAGFSIETDRGTAVVAGLPDESIFRDRFVLDDDGEFLYFSVTADHPGFMNVLRAPLTARARSLPVVSTELTGEQLVADGWPDVPESMTLGLSADGSSWLVQRPLPNDECRGMLEFVPRDGGASRPAFDEPFAKISVSVLEGRTLAYQAGCPGAAQSVGALELGDDGTFSPRLTASTHLAHPFYFNGITWDQGDLLMERRGDIHVELRISANGRVEVGPAQSPRLRDPLHEFQLWMPFDWNAGTLGGGAGGISLDHPSGASIVVIGRPDASLDALGFDPPELASATSRQVELDTYPIGPIWGATEPASGTIYDLDFAPYGEPGVGQILMAEGHDGWIIAIASIPETTPGMTRFAIDEMFDGITIGVLIEA